ncbi:ASCH domain-containing protein [Phenylobacterium soli]|uniref:ASCH domain-containing protein n=1 Tax=Phenylobacterium soli TaxID=2170551 RepID=A0A328AKC7_9CAUL|nr:ASCH domain-containing protein [Phenylobacterium soli]RAK55352.1 ASCH domain-containing protein [Phenylobacterium soli]
MSLAFTKRLREPIMRGDITCTVRIWRSVRVKVGGRYPLGSGQVEVTRIQHIDFADVTDEIARRSGFEHLADLLSVARHGTGENVYLIDFIYRA